MTDAVVIAGVSGAGKTTIGEIVAAACGYRFVDADDLHPASNRAKMASGTPLDDADRAPWLDLVGAALHEHRVVVACSALRRDYRDRLRRHCPETRVILLRPSDEELAGRVARRLGHFMPASLLQSQLATLEPLGPDEAGAEISNGADVHDVTRKVLTALRALAASPVRMDG